MALAYIQALIAVLIWATSFLLLKVALLVLEPSQIVGLRYFAGFLVLLPFLLFKSRHCLRKLSLKIWLRLALIGILAYPAGNTMKNMSHIIM